METFNVGIVKAIHVGTVAPTNTDMLWRDTSLVTPIHKFYNETTLQWESFLYSTLIDNVTIKKNINDQLYVDEAALSTFVLGDKSVTLQKMADVNSSTVFYRKTAGIGSPEIQTLAQLKTDLGLSGTNSGDQDTSVFALKTYTINTKLLNGNIVLTPSDIGSPAGSGTSTGTNTGDEDFASIMYKLGLSVLEGDNTGDQVAKAVPIEDEDELFTSDNVEDALKELRLWSNANKNVYTVSLPSSTTVAGRIAAAVAGVDYPLDWVLTAGTSPVDLLITHNMNRRIASVSVFAVTGTEEQQLFNTAAYNGIKTPTINSLLVQSLATITKTIKIYIIGS